jgi:tetratricopeptide (TPR) repeat protein
VQLYDLSNGSPHGKPIGPAGGGQVMAISPGGQSALVIHSRDELRLWDVATGTPFGLPISDKGSLDVALFSPDGRILVTGSQEHTLAFWDAATGAQLGGFLPQPGAVDCGSFSPDGKTFVAGYDIGDAQLWDVATGTALGAPFPHPGSLTAALFSPDGKMLLTACDDGRARLWDVATRTHLLPPFPRGATSAAFRPDGRAFVTGDYDGLAQLWDTATGMPLGPPLSHGSVVRRQAFSPDGKVYFTSGGSHTIHMMANSPELPEDPDRLATWVEVLTGLSLDARKGSIQVLDNESWLERRERLRRQGGPPEPSVKQRFIPIHLRPDPTARARALMERESWEAAEAAFDEAVRARPRWVSIWLERGRFHMTRGHLEKATVDLAEAIRLQPWYLPSRYEHALSLLALGDQAGLRRACSDLLDRFGTTSDPHIANTGAWCCLLGPDAVADREAAVRLAELAVNDAAESEKANHLNTLGAALYRAGRFEEAIRRLEEGIRKRGGKSLPQDWVFLALSHHRLEHRAESRRWLDRLRDRQPSEDPGRWEDELEIRLLRSEAEAVIIHDPIFPADPFAH